MKEYWKMLKRGLAMALAVVMLLTSSNLGVVLRAAATGTDDGPKKELADIVVELYADALSENLIEIIKSGELAVEKTYTYDQPTKSELITIDEEERTITAESYEDESGNVWTPVRYRLIAEGETQKAGAIEAGVPVDYYYTGNAFSVEVDYEATLELDEEQQEALLNSASLLAEDIAKLMLTGEDIIPNLKPEGWENWSEQKQKAYKDYDLIVKYEGLQNYVNDMLEKMEMSNVTLTPQMVAMFMTMPVLSYDGESDLTAIDLLSKLGAGIEQKVQIPAELLEALEDAELNNDIEDGELYVKIKFNNKNNNVVKDLLAQQEAGGLDLQKFLESNAGNSYLEWLMVPANYEALVSALTGNYDDIFQLIDDANALPGIVSDLEDLLADVETIEGAALEMISELLPELNKTLEDNDFAPFGKDVVENKADVDALVAHIEKIKKDGQTALDALLTLLNADLTNYGYAKKVTDVAGLEEAIEWVESEIAKADKQKLDALKAADAVMDAFDYPETIADPSDIEVAIAWLTEQAGADLKAAQEKVQAQLDEVNALAKSFGYTGSIASSADVDAVAAWLEAQIAADETSLQGYIDTANDALKQANAELPEDQQYKGTVKGSADIDAVMAWMNDLVADAENILAEELDKLNKELTDQGYDGEPVETAEDINNVITWIDEQVVEAENLLDEELDELNAKLAEAGYTGTVKTSKDIDAVITWVNKQVAEGEAEFKAELKKLNDQLKNEGYTGKTVETAADIDDVIAWVEGEVEKAEAKLAEELAKVSAKLQEVGYEGEVKTSADMDAVITWAQGEAAGKIAEAEKTIKDNLEIVNSNLDHLGYTGAVTCAADMDAAIAYIENGCEAYIWSEVNANLPEGVSVTSAGDVENAKSALLLAKDMGKITEAQYNDALSALDSAANTVENLPSVKVELQYFKEQLADAEKQLAEAEASVAEKVDDLKDAKADLAAVEKQLADAKAEVADKIAELKDGQKTLADAEKQLADKKDEAADRIAELEKGKTTLAEGEQKLAEAKKTAEETKVELRKGQEQLANAESQIGEAQEMADQYNKTLDSAKKNMKSLEDKIASKKANLPTQKAKLTTAKTNLKKAEDGLTNLDNDEARAITALRAEQGKISAALVRFAETTAQLDDLNAQLEDLKTVEDALAELNDGLAQMKEVQTALGEVEENKATLVETIDMLDILITMLELFCQKIEPIYTSAKADNWNVRSVLKPYSAVANYDKLTELATGETAPEVKIETSYKLPEATVSNSLAMWNVSVVAKAEYIGENNETIELPVFNAGVLPVIDKADKDAVKEAINAIMSEQTVADMLASWNDIVSFQNFSPTMSVIPETLTEDFEFVVTYRPREVIMTYGEGFEGNELAGVYKYGWNLVLPVHEDENLEWEYTVNGEKFRQGETIKITGETTISRKEGAASEKVALTKLAIDTTAGMSQTAKNILNSEALLLNDVVYVRVPNGDMIMVDPVDDLTTVTAPNYDSNVAGDWVVNTGVMDGTPVNFTNGEFTTDVVFKEIIVRYELGVSAADLGVSVEKLNDYVNAGYVLASDYNFQKTTLDTLVWALSTNENVDGAVPNLEGLSMLDRSYNIEMGSLKLSLGSALGAPDSNAELVGGMFELSPEAIAALANVLRELNRILPQNGPHPLYNTLKSYAESSNGMLYYYQNEAKFIAELNELNDIMATLPMDELAALPAAFYDLFNTIKVALGNAAALGNEENRIRIDMIDLDSAYLGALLNDLAKYDLSEQYSVSGDLNWVLEFTKAGPESKTCSVTVVVEGKGTAYAEFVLNRNDEFYHKEEAAAILEAKGWEIDDRYYDVKVTPSGNNYTYNYTYKNFAVQIEGGKTEQLNLGNQKITLPGHSNPAFAYDYTVAGEVIRVFNEDDVRTLTPAQFEALTIGGDNVITRVEVNVAEANLTTLIESMGGALYKDEKGEYTVVLGIDTNNMDNLMGLVMGLYMSGYETVSMGGETLVSNGQFHLQTIIDAVLNSGISTNKLNANIAADGTIKNTLVLPEGVTVVGTNTVNGNHLTLIESTLTFGNLPPMNLYMTLTGNGSAFKGILSTVAGYGVDVQMNNGSANLAVTVPEPFYTAYLAALSMVGEVDIRNMDAVNAEVAVGYVTKMITDILNTEGVSIETFGNTIGKDLSGYESYYDMAKSLMNLVKYDEDGCSIILDLPVIPIKGVIDSLEGSIQLPIEGVSLGGLIAEYETGLDVAVGAKINNFANKYDVLFVDVKADGLSKKFGMANLGKDGLLDLQTTSAVVLLHNIEGDLYIPDTLTLVDLNGFNVSGTIKGGASADVLVIDSNYEADKGVVGGVSGNVTVLAGKYNSDVSAFVNDGYMQDSKGVVCNKLFTVSETDNVITVTLNTTVADAKTLLTQEGVFGLAAEILFDQFINHYNVAGVSMDGNTIYNINFEDILGIVSGGTDAIVDTALGFIDAPALANVFNLLVKDLTDFKTMGAALSDEGTGVIASHEFTTTTWGLELAHKAENDTLTVNFGGSYGKTESKTLQLEIEGQARGAMATLATALGDVLTVDLRVENVEDIYRNDAGQFNLKGDVVGTVVFDFTHNPNYAIMISAILAENADEALRADLVAGIESFYATGSMDELHEVFNAMTIEDVCNSWDEHIGVDSFVEIVDSLGLTCADEIKAAIDDSEMGFDLLIDGIAAGLRLLNEHGIGESITDSGRTWGSLELEDADGSYYGRAGSFEIAGTNRLMDYRLTAASVGAKIYLFSDEVLPINDPSITITYGDIKHDKLHGVKYEDGFLILDTVADGMTLDEVLAALYKGTDVTNDHDDLPEYVAEESTLAGDGNLVGTGSRIVLRARNSVNKTVDVELKIVILGDTTCNGRLDVGDAVVMSMFVLGEEQQALTEIQIVAANANCLTSSFGREGVDSGDAVIVMNKCQGNYDGVDLPLYDSPLDN